MLDNIERDLHFNDIIGAALDSGFKSATIIELV
jgi:hypothetical protein